MRVHLSLLALGVGLTLAIPAQAQKSVSFSGVDPTRIINQPVDTSSAARSVGGSQTVSTGFKLSSYFPSFSFSGSKPTVGRSTFPTNGQLPGRDYLKAFGYNNFQPFK